MTQADIQTIRLTNGKTANGKSQKKKRKKKKTNKHLETRKAYYS